MTTEKTSFLKSFISFIGSLPFHTKLLLIFMPIVVIDLASNIIKSPLILAGILGLMIGVIITIAIHDHSRFLEREKKVIEEEALFSEIEKSLSSLQDAVEEIHQSKETYITDGETKIPVPECAVILGSNDSVSYLIPYNLETFAAQEINALENASSLLKKKGLPFQILRYKSNHPFFKTQPKAKVAVEPGKISSDFPFNFLNFN